MASIRKKTISICKTCEKEFHPFYGGKGWYCSMKCRDKYNKREFHQNWKGGKFINTNGYRAVYMPEHPKAWQCGYIYEHRLVMEKKLGRLLKDFPEETVNHIDRNKLNNNPNNLEVLSNSDHSILTHTKYNGIPKECLFCGMLFKKNKRLSLKQWAKTVYCSLSCSANGNESVKYALIGRLKKY